jgi:hypothetical protein
MKTTHVVPKLASILAGTALAAAVGACAAGRLSIQMDLPGELPPLVAVEPGVEVVQDYDEEIFFVDGYYWVRRDGRWYRARNYRDRWLYVEPRYVAPALVRIPPGQYRHWRGAAARTDRGQVAEPEERGGRVQEDGRSRGEPRGRQDERGREHEEGRGREEGRRQGD